MLINNLLMSSEQKEIKRILAGNIKKYRARLKITQEQAAEKAGITTKYWQRLEMESQIDLPSLPTLFLLAKALKIHPSKLLVF
jgi:transcriptional regulator with XRE-family HTH domain